MGAALLTVLVLTGVILWWPGLTRWTEALGVHSGKGWRRMLREGHWVTGSWTAGLLLLWSVSGLYLCFPGPFRDAVSAVLPLTAIRPPVSAGGAAGEDVAYDVLVSRAQALVPDGQVARLALPATDTASIGVVLARWAHGDFDTSDEVTVYFDRRTGELLGLDDQSSRTVGDRAMTWLGVLHVGSFGGVPVRVLWMVAGFAFPGLAISGAIMWWTRRSGYERRDDS